MQEEKKIILQGTNNRYQMKKATKTGQEKDKKRKEAENWNISIEDYTYEKQMELLKEMKEIKTNENKEENPTKSIHQLVIQQIERKMSNYKHQDLEKKVYEPEKIAKYSDVLSILLETEAKCFYCFSKVFILYEKIREGKQWTLDRINNDLGHNTDNVVLSCLECNLKRRCQSKDGFLFTKQLKIIKREKDS
jgi:hypothetical protein